MLETIQQAGLDAESVQSTLAHAIQELYCKPIEIITQAARRANLSSRIMVSFTIPRRPGEKLSKWQVRHRRGYQADICIPMTEERLDCGHSHAPPRYHNTTRLFTPLFGEWRGYNSTGLVEVALKRSDAFYPEMLTALVAGVNELGRVVLEEIQEKSERDTDLSCIVQGTQKVNQDLLDALDKNRVLAN